MDAATRAGIELLTVEYIEEVVNAGGAKLLNASDLAQFISELVLNNYGPGVREAARGFALSTAQMCLLPEECRRRGLEVDGETVEKLREALQ